MDRAPRMDPSPIPDLPGRRGSPTVPKRPASTSSTSTARRANSTIPEILPPGVGLLDYDNDGDLDVYLVQGRRLGAGKDQLDSGATGARAAQGPAVPQRSAASRPDGTRTLRFTDVTDASGIDATQYGLGVASGDIDNDGWVDLLLTNFGTNQLFRNNGDGTFTDISKPSGIHDESGRFARLGRVRRLRSRWMAGPLRRQQRQSTRCENKEQCPNIGGRPRLLPAADLWRAARSALPKPGPRTIRRRQREGARRRASSDRRSASRQPTTTATGGSTSTSPTTARKTCCGSTSATARSKKRRSLAGAALTAEGKAEASMGVDAGDFDNDGDEDLVMTELTSQGFNLYVNDGSGKFRDLSAASGLGPVELAVYRLGLMPGSTSTTTGGSTCWRSTARSSPWSNARIGRFPTTSGKCCSATFGTGASRT